MGFLKNLFDANSKPRNAVNIVAPAWKLILDREPDANTFDIAKLIVSMRPQQYHDNYMSILDMLKNHSLSQSDSIPEAMRMKYSPSSFVWLVIDIEYGIEKDMLSEKMRENWEQVIRNELKAVGLN